MTLPSGRISNGNSPRVNSPDLVYNLDPNPRRNPASLDQLKSNMLKLILAFACALCLLVQSTLGQSLKLYPEANLQGEAQPLEDGYYDKLDRSINDRAVSFELAPGHIATFADNANGTGPSRVYIAAEEKLSINLPPSLQKTVSFIRVSPWKNTHKKSACNAGTAMLDTLNVSWFYNWDSKGQSTESVQFVPMNWGKWKTIEMQELGQRMDVSHHLGFNEPDEPEQANMTVDLAIEKFKLLQASGLRLGSPSPKDNQVGRDWLDEFMAKALKEGLRVDFIAVHYYKKSKPEQFRHWLDYVDKKYNLPIWVTEFNYGATWNWKAKPNKEYVAGLISYLEMLDAAEYVERYSFYNWQPPSGFSIYASKDPAVLNTAGKAFKNHRSQPSPIPRNYVPSRGLTIALERFIRLAKRVSAMTKMLALLKFRRPAMAFPASTISCTTSINHFHPTR